MGLLDRIAAKANPYAEDEYDEYEDTDYVDYEDDDDAYYEDEAEVSPIRSIAPVQDVARIVTVWVSSFNTAADFAKEFRAGLPVILNLSEAGDTERRRIVDFACGLCFGLEGSFSSISDDVFLLTPAEVRVDARGSDKAHDFI